MPSHNELKTDRIEANIYFFHSHVNRDDVREQTRLPLMARCK